MVATTTFMLARMLVMAAIIKAMRKAGLLRVVLKVTSHSPVLMEGRW